MKKLFLLNILIQFVFTDTIVIDYSSIFYRETKTIENIEYLGVVNHAKSAYKITGINKIFYVNTEDILKIYDDNNIEIDIYEKIYSNNIGNNKTEINNLSNISLVNKINNTGSILKNFPKKFYMGNNIQLASIIVSLYGINTESNMLINVGYIGAFAGWFIAYTSFIEIVKAGEQLKQINDKDIEELKNLQVTPNPK
tara:strand:- start:49 stop:639 length:591 start_codon:yes stop_codon:yes gene_type:complete